MITRTDPLTVAIRDLTDRHQSPPCRGTQSHLWTSDHAKERAEAATRCVGCPIIDVCREQSGNEVWWVWAGVDHTQSTSGARRAVRHGCVDCGQPLLKTRTKRCKDCHIESITRRNASRKETS